MPIYEPEISWKGETPVSDQAGDIYYSPENGFEETTHVFIKGNNLLDRWTESVNAAFTILETGFGTGLNFITACHYFLKISGPGQRLHFVSIEKYPLAKQDIQRALSVYPDLAEITSELLEKYPPRICGTHRLDLFEGRIVLTLVLNDIVHALNNIHIPAGADAVFLDGFNPAVNPEMWAEENLLKLASFARESCTLATFTAAGHVKRSLEAAGFEITKLPGYGKKREMITGIMRKNPGNKKPKPWYFPGNIPYNNIKNSQKKITVIGSGLAGCALAGSFASRGWNVTVIEEAENICTGASGNPLGIYFPVVHRKPTFTDRLSLSAYLWFIKRNSLADINPEPSGLVQVLNQTEAGSRFADYARQHESLEKTFSLDYSEVIPGEPDNCNVFYPRSGFVSPGELAAKSLENAVAKGRVRFVFNTKVKSLKRTEHEWNILGKDSEVLISSELVVLANSFGITQMEQTNWLPLNKIRGQLVWSRNAIPGFTVPVSGEIYVIPGKDRTIVGATHDLNDESGIRPEQGTELLQKASTLVSSEKSPEWKNFFEEALNQSGDFSGPNWQARVAWRSAAVDHFPVIGPVPDRDKFLDEFTELKDGELNYFRKQEREKGSGHKPDVWHENLYCMTGLGSRGIIYSQIGAEIIASEVCGEPAPVEKDILEALNPARFLYRQIKHKGR